MSNSTRIGVSLSTKLLYNFEKVLNEMGYRSRSSGIQDALKNFIEQYDESNEIEGVQIGTITIIYHNYTSVSEKIVHIINEYNMCIDSVIQACVTDKQFIEVIVVKGNMKYITNLSNKLMGLNDVEEVKLSSTLLKWNQTIK